MTPAAPTWGVVRDASLVAVCVGCCVGACAWRSPAPCRTVEGDLNRASNDTEWCLAVLALLARAEGVRSWSPQSAHRTPSHHV